MATTTVSREQRRETKEQDRPARLSRVCGHLRLVGIDLSGDSYCSTTGAAALCRRDAIFSCRHFALRGDAPLWPSASRGQRVGQSSLHRLADVRGDVWRGVLGRAVRAFRVHLCSRGDVAAHHHRPRGLCFSPAAIPLEPAGLDRGRIRGCPLVTAAQCAARCYPALRRHPAGWNGLVAGCCAHPFVACCPSRRELPPGRR